MREQRKRISFVKDEFQARSAFHVQSTFHRSRHAAGAEPLPYRLVYIETAEALNASADYIGFVARGTSSATANDVCRYAFAKARLDIFALWQIRYNRPCGRFRYDIRLFFSCEAHIESVRTYRA